MTVLTLAAADVAPRSYRAKALVFEDPASRSLLLHIEQVAPSEATVLITGETGTGKEIVARRIHDLSARRGGPFVAVNCGALSESLIDSELFGHEAGAFTGAVGARPGWFEAAAGGTLFLDEIGELPPALQVKLLRVLQEREVVRVGARQPVRIDVRLIAATNADLAGDVATGRFRADLFYRLDVATVALPPLRERPGDIVPLADYFVELYAHRLGGRRKTLAPAARERLLQHPWPGNIRELENVIHRAVLACRDGCIDAEHLRLAPAALRRDAPAPPPPPLPMMTLEAGLLALFEAGGDDLYRRIDDAVIRMAYRFCHGNQVQTARLLGISRNIVRARLLQSGELAASPRAASGPDAAIDAALDAAAAAIRGR